MDEVYWNPGVELWAQICNSHTKTGCILQTVQQPDSIFIVIPHGHMGTWDPECSQIFRKREASWACESSTPPTNDSHWSSLPPAKLTKESMGGRI